MPGSDTPSRTASSPPRAFVVEDDPLTRQMIAAHAERFGFTAVEVDPEMTRIADAVDRAGSDDVLILDIILGPDIDGFEVMRMLGAAKFAGRLVVVSGFGTDYLRTLESLAVALGIRVAGALEKPVRPADLQRCLMV